MKLRDCIRQFEVIRIAERRKPLPLSDFSAYMGDIDLADVTPVKVRKFVARTDFVHYQALRAFVEWLNKQDREEIPPPDPVEAEYETLFRYLTDAGRVF